jgi:hypothetical protein
VPGQPVSTTLNGTQKRREKIVVARRPATHTKEKRWYLRRQPWETVVMSRRKVAIGDVKWRRAAGGGNEAIGFGGHRPSKKWKARHHAWSDHPGLNGSC